MKIFLNLNFNEEEIESIIEINNEIANLTDDEIINLINILKHIECDDTQIKNIIINNPFYLNRVQSDVIGLINYLKELKFSYLNLLFDNNPLLLNKDVFEIKEFILKKQNEGYLLNDIIDIIDSNSFIIDDL